jgi:GDPmannose 4,6-dehydratase
MFRPAAVDLLVGDATKAREVPGRQFKAGFPEPVRLMVDADTALERGHMR